MTSWRTYLEPGQLENRLADGAARFVGGFQRRELLTIAILFAVITWSLYAFTLATPGLLDRNGNLKAGDFLQFYTAGHVAQLGDADLLYNPEAYAREGKRLVPETPQTFLPLYPPQLSVLFWPASHLSYGQAAIAWSLLSILLYATAGYVVWRQCPALREYRGLIAMLAVGSPAFFDLIGHGQTTSISLLLLAAMLVPLCTTRNFLAGLTFGLLVFKPHFGLAGSVVLAINREWRMLLGAATGASLQLAVAWLWYGTDALVGYLEFISRPELSLMMLETDLFKSHSLRTQWTLLLPSQSLALAGYGVTSIAILVRMTGYWRSSAPTRLRYSALLITTILVSPHVFAYDLVVLLPAFLLIVDWSLAHPSDRHSPLLRLLLGIAFVSPFLHLVAQFTRIQVSILTLLALLVVVTRLETSSAPAPAPTLREASPPA